MTACLNESPSKKEGKCGKALRLLVCPACRLNESPSKKEGKCRSGSSTIAKI